MEEFQRFRRNSKTLQSKSNSPNESFRQILIEKACVFIDSGLKEFSFTDLL